MLKYDKFIIEKLWKDIEELGYILSDENIHHTIVQYHAEFDWRIKSGIGEVLKMGRIIRRLLGSELFTNLEISNVIRKINKNQNYLGTIIIHPQNTGFSYITSKWFRNIDDDPNYLEYLDRVEETIQGYGFKLEIDNKVFLNIFK